MTTQPTDEQASPGAGGTPRVAVIVPCHEDGEFAVEAVGSIEEAEPIEIVVVDDGSRDRATALALDSLKAGGIRVMRLERNRGVSAARNAGLRATSAPYVFPLDADDLAVPSVLGTMADVLEENPDAVVCFGDYVEFGHGRRLRTVPKRIDPYRLAYTNEYPISALFRRRILEDLGGWPELFAYEDWHIWMSLAERNLSGVHLGFGRPTYERRIHGDRLLTRARGEHRRLYERLRADHPELFAALRKHRSASGLTARRKALYPIVYGRHTRSAWHSKVKDVLERLRIWTPQR